MAIQNKAEIRAYFELNDDSCKDVAKRFNVNYRTLMHWVKNECWEKGKFTKGIKPEIIRDDLLQKEQFSLTAAASSRLKRQMLSQMGDGASALDDAILNAMLDERSEKLLLEAMSLNFIQKSLAETAIIAKAQLKELLNRQSENFKPAESVILIQAAEKVANMLTNLQTALYGKDAKIQTIGKIEDYSKLTNAELEAIINS